MRKSIAALTLFLSILLIPVAVAGAAVPAIPPSKKCLGITSNSLRGWIASEKGDGEALYNLLDSAGCFRNSSPQKTSNQCRDYRNKSTAYLNGFVRSTRSILRAHKIIDNRYQRRMDILGKQMISTNDPELRQQLMSQINFLRVLRDEAQRADVWSKNPRATMRVVAPAVLVIDQVAVACGNSDGWQKRNQVALEAASRFRTLYQW